MKNEQFEEIRMMDNFYQNSMYFPMPLTLIGTLDEKGEKTSYGAYSLIFPYYIAGKDHYTMVLECRNTSNTAKGLLRHGKCTINFLPCNRASFAQHVDCGFPGDTPEEKMKGFRFTPVDSFSQKADPKHKYPKVLDEAIQVLECSWWKELDNAQDDKVEEEYPGPYHNFNGITSKFGAHFILKIDKVILKKKYREALVNGTTKWNFPPIPTNWGYRDSKNFWCSAFKKPIAVGIPNRQVDLSSIKYAVERLACTDVIFEDEALEKLVKVPRPFLKSALIGCIDWAHQHGVTRITVAEMRQIKDKRNAEKNK